MMKKLTKNVLVAIILGLWVTNSLAEAKYTYYFQDALGSPIVATDEHGSVLWRKTYRPYGESDQSDALNDVGYTGHMEDYETGLIYMQERYYHPRYIRFLSFDPVKFSESEPMSFNPSIYALNNPYKYVDPDGNASKVAALIRLTSAGMKELGRLSKEQAVRARKNGQNVMADNRQVAGQIERAAAGNKEVLKHQGHKLPDGNIGKPHFQTEGVTGHTFWGGVSSVFLTIGVGLDHVADVVEIVDPTTYISSGGQNYVDPDGNPISLEEVYGGQQAGESEGESADNSSSENEDGG